MINVKKDLYLWAMVLIGVLENAMQLKNRPVRNPFDTSLALVLSLIRNFLF
jgi:hypothetical protein